MVDVPNTTYFHCLTFFIGVSLEMFTNSIFRERNFENVDIGVIPDCTLLHTKNSYI